MRDSTRLFLAFLAGFFARSVMHALMLENYAGAAIGAGIACALLYKAANG